LPIRVVQLGSPRQADEGVRIGAVRRPPRGVRKERYACEDWYDVWCPELSPTPELMVQGKSAASDADWIAFVRRFRHQMSEPQPSRLLDLLAALSEGSSFSVGCYCRTEDLCHRSVLRALLAERGARVF
jgi:uncharacterized protein YeaO (DUF488 family)